MSEFNIEKALEFMEIYISTYRNQPCYSFHNEATWINDILYGLGVSVSDEYRFAQGFHQFKEKLKEDYV